MSKKCTRSLRSSFCSRPTEKVTSTLGANTCLHEAQRVCEASAVSCIPLVMSLLDIHVAHHGQFSPNTKRGVCAWTIAMSTSIIARDTG